MKSSNVVYENLIKNKIDYIGLTDVSKLLDISLGLELVEEAYSLISNNEIDSPSKLSVFLPENSSNTKAWMNAMPALIKSDNIVGQKWVSVCSNNKDKNLPTTIGTILLNDALTGMPRAIIDGTYITHIRTGASVAIGVKYFTPVDLEELALIGAGVEARTTLLAISKVRNIKTIKIYDINFQNIQSLIDELSDVISAKFITYDSAEKAVAGSRCIIICTTASKPVIYKDWCNENAFICSLSGVRDIDKEIITASNKVVFDRSDAALKRIEILSNIKLDKQNSIDICDYILKNSNKVYSHREAGFLTYLPLGLGGVDVYIANYLHTNKVLNIS